MEVLINNLEYVKINRLRLLTQAFVLVLLFCAYLKEEIFFSAGILFLISVLYLRENFFKAKKYLWIFIFLFVISLFSIIIILNDFDSITRVFKILCYACLWFFVAYYGFTVGYNLSVFGSQKDKFFTFLICVFLFNAIVTIIAWFTTTGGAVARYNFVSPISNATSANLHLTTLGVLIALEKFNYRKFSSYLVLLIFLLNFLVVIVRAEQVILLFSLFLYFLVKTKKQMHIKVFALTIVFFVSIMLLATTSIYSYLTSVFSDNSAALRKLAINDAVRLFKKNPLTGIGYGMYPPLKSPVVELGSVHNGVFSMIAETGIVGVSLCIGIVILILKTICFLYKTNIINNKYNKTISIILLASIVRSFFQNTHFFPPPAEMSYYLFGMLLWMFLGIFIKQKSFNIITGVNTSVTGMFL